MSPGFLDDYEWTWLKSMIGEDQELDDLEMRLLLNIAEEATSIPEDFDTFAQSFEEVEYEDEGETTFFYARITRALKNKIRKRLN
jgi:hypothetical protein